MKKGLTEISLYFWTI